MTRFRSRVTALAAALLLATTLTFRPSTTQAMGPLHGAGMIASPILAYICGSADMKILCIASAAVTLLSMGFGMGGMFAPETPVNEADEAEWKQVRSHFEPAFMTVHEEAVKQAFHQTRRGASAQEVEQTLRLGELLQ